MPSKTMRFLYPLTLLVVPYVVIYFSGLARWQGRLVGSSIFIFLLTVGIFWFGISRKWRIIPPSGKLARPEYDAVRPRIELAIRILILAFAVSFTIYVTLPFTADLARFVAGEKPTVITGTVVALCRTCRASPLEQSVWLRRSATSDIRKYYLLYPDRRVRVLVGQAYEFTVLPRSRLILDFRQ